MLQPKIINVKPLDNHQLLLKFENGEIKHFDVNPYISGDWYGKLNNETYFQKVHIGNQTVEWPDGQDIAPHELYWQSS